MANGKDGACCIFVPAGGQLTVPVPLQSLRIYTIYTLCYCATVLVLSRRQGQNVAVSFAPPRPSPPSLPLQCPHPAIVALHGQRQRQCLVSRSRGGFLLPTSTTSTLIADIAAATRSISVLSPFLGSPSHRQHVVPSCPPCPDDPRTYRVRRCRAPVHVPLQVRHVTPLNLVNSGCSAPLSASKFPRRRFEKEKSLRSSPMSGTCR